MSGIKPFEPKFMPIGVLTAALQELTPRERRDADPDLAVEEWLEFAVSLGADCIELSAALHPSLADVPPEAMLDPVANTWDLRRPFDQSRAERVLAAVDSTGVAIADIGYIDDMLHENPAIRRKKHDFMVAAMNAATLLGVPAVTGFVGRNQAMSMDQNLVDLPVPEGCRVRLPHRRHAREGSGDPSQGCRTSRSFSRFWRARWRSRGTSTAPRHRCSLCSPKCWRRRESRCRASDVRRTAADQVARFRRVRSRWLDFSCSTSSW